jgi:hypothetical protein
MRRLPAILLLLLIAGAAAWTLFRWNAGRTEAVDPWAAMPAHTAVVLEFPDAFTEWDRLMHTSQHWTALEQLPGMAAAGRMAARIRSRMEDDAELRRALDGAPVVLGLLRTGGQGTGLLLACAPRHHDEAARTAMANALQLGAHEQAALAKGTVVTLAGDSALKDLSLCHVSGLWLLSGSRDVLEEALLEVRNGQGLTSDTLFTKARNTLGDGSNAHLLIHLERARNLLANWWTAETLKPLEDLPRGWAALDLEIRSDALLMSGLVVPEDAHRSWERLAHQGSGDLPLLRSLPAGVERMEAWHISDALQWARDLDAAAEDSLQEGLLAWVNGPVMLAHGATDSLAPAVWAFLSTADPDAAAEAIRSYRPPQPGDTLSYRGLRFARLPSAQDHERLLGPAFAALERPWWCVIGDQVVFAASPQRLSQAVDAWTDGNSLAEDARTSAWWARMNTAAGRLWWCDVSRHRSSLAPLLHEKARSAAAAQDELWGQVGGITVQLAQGQRGLHPLVIGIQHVPIEVRPQRTLWSASLGAAVERAPDIVVNHTNNTREVLVQDAQHRIHLISAAGKVLWTKQLDGPIRGSVHQVDRFRNGKLQLLFNTGAQVYLIDRNGKDVGGFPVKPKAGATAPLAVFDYDGQRDYRVLLPLKDGRVLNLGLDGIAVQGWEPPRLKEPSTAAVEHVRIRNKDHLLVFDGSGSVLVLDRRGQVRERVKLDLGADARVRLVRAGSELGATQVAWTDTEGTLKLGTLDGTVRELGRAPQGWAALQWTTDGVEGATIASDSVRIGRDGAVAWQRGFGATPAAVAWHAVTGTGEVLSVALPARDELLLFDEAGGPLPDMPLKGAGTCAIADLDLDGRSEVIAITAQGQVIAQSIGLRRP